MKGMEALEMEEAESFLPPRTNGKSKGSVNERSTSGFFTRNKLYILAIVAILFGMHHITFEIKNKEDEDVADKAPTQAASAPSPTTPAAPPTTPATSSSTSSSSSTTTTKTDDSSPFQNTGSGGEEKNMKYSEISKITPDPEHLPIDDETRAELTEKYGKWHFWDGDEDNRPSKDYCAKFPNRDVDGDDFPDEAWQVDAVFVNHLINDAEQLVTRAMEAIFEEYGHGKPLPPEGLAERMKMFRWDKIDFATQMSAPAKYTKKGTQGGGGWTTERSFQGLVRRVLHAMHTNDDFVVVMGGHSAAAGHGNHFRQSYMMQFHRTMEPIFARLGVKLITRNVGQGGLGTLHNGLGAGSIYGDNIDILIWDSGMTEREASHVDLFIRQGMLGGKKVPLVWMAAGGNFEVAKALHEHADVDIGMFGNGMDGIPETINENQAQTLPWAARYLKCSTESNELCNNKKNKYCATCWIPRDDIDPVAVGFKKIDSSFPSQVSWHAGNRKHQLTGRVLAFSVLEALQDAIQIWSDGTMGGPPLDDDYWHVTEYYDNIRNKLKNLDTSVGACYSIEGLPSRVCKTPMKARTLHTPRANPAETSLTTLLKPASDGYIPKNELKLLYEGPDKHNQCFDVPDGAVDVLAVVSGRRRLAETSLSSELLFDELYDSVPTTTIELSEQNATRREISLSVESSSRRLDTIVPGKGWQVYEERPGLCNGEYHPICGRSVEDTCPMAGHHDHRGSLAGNEYSGWVVMELPDVSEGIIILKLFTWLKPDKNTRTQGWSTVNNERRMLRKDTSRTDEDVEPSNDHVEGRSYQRHLGEKQNLPETFEFDYAINGKITTLNKAQFLEQVHDVQRVFEAITLLDDPGFSGGPKVEVAFRMRGCGRDCTFGLTHVYWA